MVLVLVERREAMKWRTSPDEATSNTIPGNPHPRREALYQAPPFQLRPLTEDEYPILARIWDNERDDDYDSL